MSNSLTKEDIKQDGCYRYFRNLFANIEKFDNPEDISNAWKDIQILNNTQEEYQRLIYLNKHVEYLFKKKSKEISDNKN